VAKILVSGIVGGLAQRVAEKLLAGGHQVIGVDYREMRGALPGALSQLKVYRANYNKTIIEDVFRHHAIDVVLHLGRVGNLKESAGKRFDLNVVGSQKIMNLCVQHGVKRLVVLSTFHIYGAHPANHIPIAEDEPLRAGLQFPQIADAIQMDNMASTWVWHHPEVKTIVLRPTNIIGPTLHNTMSQFLRLPRAPYLLGFNPMTQFVHEDDMAAAIVSAAQSDLCGIYNVAGPDVIPWRTALKLARAVQFPITEGLASLFMRATGGFPQYLINFFRYPCVITDRAFRTQSGWAPRVSMEETLRTTVAGARPPEFSGAAPA
jgi:UDP-glucose 4-epimerase